MIPIKVMLIEDNREYRSVLEFALKNEGDMTLVSQFGNAEMAIANLNELAKESLPDVILLDLHLPRMSGSKALPYIKNAAPKAAVIILTQSDAESDVFDTLSLGAVGYLLKSSKVSQVKEAIRQVMSGGSPIDVAVATYLIASLKKHPNSISGQHLLSNREYQVLELLAEGLQKKEIAAKLDLSVPTVNTHVKHVYEKLDVQNAPAAVRVAYKLGIF